VLQGSSRSSLRRVRLGTILAILVLSTTVPLGLFAARLIYTSWEQQKTLVNRQNMERARAINAALDREVQNTIAELRVLASLEPIDRDNLQPFHALASRTVELLPGWESVRLVDPSSLKVLVSTAMPYGESSTLLTDDWVRSVRTTTNAAVSTSQRDPATGNFFVSVGVPVMRGQRLLYVLGARLPVSQFSEVLRTQPAPAEAIVALLDSDLAILARTVDEKSFIGGKPNEQFAAAVRSASEGYLRSMLRDGTPTYAAFNRSALTGWTVALGMPASAIDGPLLWSSGALIAFMAAIFVSGFLMVLFVRRRIVRAQTAAIEAVRALARSESFSLTDSSVVEFNELADGLREAAAILDRRLEERDRAESERAKAVENLERALAGEQAARAAGERNEARLSVTLRSIGDAVIATDAEGRITMLNPVAQTLTGWAESEAIGRPIDAVFETVDEQTRRPRPSPIDRIRANEETDAAKIAPSYTVLMARDGRDIPIGDSAAAIRGVDGALLGIVVVFRDVTADREGERQRAAALEREQAARRQAESLSRAKDEFVATVSHELRTPLNAIFGWVAMLKMGSLDDAGRAKALEVIERNTRAQAQLIEDLLDMARVIRGTIRLEMQAVDLAAVLDAALDAVKPAADARRVQITVRAPRGVACVSGDASRLQQICWNLLSNAIKFSEAGDEVTVDLAAEDDEAVLRVHDTGAGIAPAFLPHVFDRFRQEMSDVTREHAGLGLGLALVRHLAELHGGTVSAESAGKDLGATFTVRLPIMGARVAPQDAATDGFAADVNGHTLQGLDTLVVEDDPDTRELMTTVLEQAGANVRSAESVRQALELLENKPPDVVVTDIAMPQATGFDLVKQIREDPRWVGIPTIAVTAYARAEDRAQALALGFNAHVGKPFTPRVLVAIVAEWATAASGARKTIDRPTT
jgi:PAS domain S-box-containing protein